MAADVEVKVVREVDLPHLVGKALEFYLGKALLAYSKGISKRAPVEYGVLRGSLQPGGKDTLTGLDSAKPPQWAKIGTAVKYAGPLNDPITRDPHYRNGPYAGESTAGWFDKGIDDATPDLEGYLAEAAEMIEDGWRA